MQAEETIEIERGIGAALARLRNRDRRTHVVVVWFAEGNDDVETVHGAALEEDNHFLFVWGWGADDGALQEGGEGGHAEHGYAAVFQEVASGDGHLVLLWCALRETRTSAAEAAC